MGVIVNFLGVAVMVGVKEGVIEGVMVTIVGVGVIVGVDEGVLEGVIVTRVGVGVDVGVGEGVIDGVIVINVGAGVAVVVGVCVGVGVGAGALARILISVYATSSRYSAYTLGSLSYSVSEGIISSGILSKSSAIPTSGSDGFIALSRSFASRNIQKYS